MKNTFQNKGFNIYLGIFFLVIGTLGSWSSITNMLEYINNEELKYLYKGHMTFTGNAAFYMNLALFIAGIIFILLGINYLRKSRDYN